MKQNVFQRQYGQAKKTSFLSRDKDFGQSWKGNWISWRDMISHDNNKKDGGPYNIYIYNKVHVLLKPGHRSGKWSLKWSASNQPLRYQHRASVRGLPIQKADLLPISYGSEVTTTRAQGRKYHECLKPPSKAAATVILPPMAAPNDPLAIVPQPKSDSFLTLSHPSLLTTTWGKSERMTKAKLLTRFEEIPIWYHQTSWMNSPYSAYPHFVGELYEISVGSIRDFHLLVPVPQSRWFLQNSCWISRWGFVLVWTIYRRVTSPLLIPIIEYDWLCIYIYIPIDYSLPTLLFTIFHVHSHPFAWRVASIIIHIIPYPHYIQILHNKLSTAPSTRPLTHDARHRAGGTTRNLDPSPATCL